MPEFGPWTVTDLDDDDWNELLDHGLEKITGYVFRINGSYYEIIKGGTTSGAGTIVYGGAENAGGIDGTDAQAVMQATIDALELDGFGSIFAKKGDYTFNAGVTIEDAIIDILAEPGAVFDFQATSGSCITIDMEDLSSANLYKTPLLNIEGLTIKLQNDDTKGIYVYRSNYIAIDRCQVKSYVGSGTAPIGIHLIGGCFNVQITRCKLYGNTSPYYGTGIKFENDAHGHPNNSHVGYCRDIDNWATAIDLTGGGHVLFVGNIIQRNTTGFDIGIGTARIIGNWIEQNTTGIAIDNGLGSDTWIENNRFQGNTADFASTTSYIRPYGNDNFVTENSGTGSVTNGGTTDVIAHGLDVTPSVQDITIMGAENPTNDVGTIWIDTIGAANFTVNVENDPGASNWDFGWRVAITRMQIP